MKSATRSAAAVMAVRSPLWLRGFGRLFARDLARSFHAIRFSGEVPDGPGPLVLVANHPSWWDGELFVVLATTLFPDRRGYVPIEADMLARYGFFRRLGAFAVEPGYAGASTFLRVGEAVLSRDDGALVVNAEGRFRDVRARPLQLAAGLAHLARRRPEARFVPLAIEYAFWNERRPNGLLRFGPSIPGARVAADPARLADALTATMDALAADAEARDPARFTSLVEGRTRIDPVYDAWRRAVAALRGRRFDPAHGARPGVAP